VWEGPPVARIVTKSGEVQWMGRQSTIKTTRSSAWSKGFETGPWPRTKDRSRTRSHRPPRIPHGDAKFAGGCDSASDRGCKPAPGLQPVMAGGGLETGGFDALCGPKPRACFCTRKPRSVNHLHESAKPGQKPEGCSGGNCSPGKPHILRVVNKYHDQYTGCKCYYVKLLINPEWLNTKHYKL